VTSDEWSAEIRGGKIIVRVPLSHLLLCARIPGARWDSALQAWTYPATARHAARLRAAIPGLRLPQSLDRTIPAIAEKRSATQAVLAPVPVGLKTRPWRHQLEAYRFVMECFRSGRQGVMLAMAMGTGKSLAASMILLGLEARRVLIACPLRVIPVWVAELERHVSVPMVVVALDEDAGSVAEKQRLADEKLRLAESMGVPFVAVINYDSAWREPFASWAEKQAWDLIIADESHKLKAPGGKASLYFKRLRNGARYRLGLTGTPMPHSPLDIYAQFRFLDPSVFGPSFHAFKQKYAVMGGFKGKQVAGYKNLDELEASLRRVTFRVSKDALDLPEEMRVTYRCTLSPEAQAIYAALEQDFIADVQGGRITVANAMVALLRLQQLTGGWLKTDDGRYRRVDFSKQRLLEDTLDDIGPEEPVVVFCRFHADLDVVHDACASLGLSSLELSGRRSELDRWQAGDAQVLAVQIASGGLGVDLTRARYAIYYSLSFSLGEYDQAHSRVHRPKQTRPVQHIQLVARNTVDEKIVAALERRAEVIEAILEQIQSERRTK